ncbi:site-specific integrase [Sphingobium sp. WCS2017Hpa-17]|uniref:site-specific integrase n=1 Tax=Sphingobium sp. WCS2017Hpa-17 TaxID=3073638 RepID=UPI00288A3897|nr:site-specific integrase [Sphingobium sp. WCS2017Hpa-17]
MAAIRGLWQDKRSGIYYIRRKIPEPLRPAFNCGEFYKVTLSTGDPREAEKRFAIANGEYEKKLADFREALAKGGGSSLSAAEAATLVSRLLTARSGGGFAIGGTQVAFMLRELDEAVADQTGERIPTAKSMSSEEWIAYRRSLAGSDDDDAFSPETLAAIEAEHAARYRAPGEAWFDFQRRVSRRRWRPLLGSAVVDIKRQLKLPEKVEPGIDEPLADALAETLQSADVRDQLPNAPSARRQKQKSRAQPDMKLGALLKFWKAKRTPSPKACVAAEKAVEDFISFVGDVGIGEITADDCFEFRDAVEQLPRSMPRAHRALAFNDAHAIYAGRVDVERLSPQSVKKYLGAIQALLGFAFQERYIGANPGAGIKVDGYSKKSDRRPFTKEELRRLFSADLFTQSWSIPISRSKVSDLTLRWLFLLGLVTGARIEELGQILLADVKEELGVPYIDVTDYVEDDVDEANRVKTDGSVRVLPLHPQLIALGFLDYVGRQRAKDAVKLFPDLVADALEVKTKEASRRAARLIDDAVGKDPRIVFHSFRHSFKDLCRDANIPKDVHDQLTGHAAADVGGGYGLGRAVLNLARHMKKLKLTFIDWDAIEIASRK